MNLSNWIERQADFAPDRCAIRFAGEDLNYARLAQKINRLADSLDGRLGIRRGDRIAYLGLNSPEILVLLFACAKLGAVLMPLNWRLAKPEHLYMLRQAEPNAIFVMPEFVEHVQDMRCDIESVALVSFDESGSQAVRMSWTGREQQDRDSAQFGRLLLLP